MGASLLGFVFGAAVGACTGTEIGAFAGAVVGMLVGLSIHGFGWARARLGDAPTVERHVVMCTPFGRAAELELVGDLQVGRWYDVKSCSLLEVATKVDCDKGCLGRVRDAGVRPGRACGCEVAAPERHASLRIAA
jgi:hypothetical protein